MVFKFGLFFATVKLRCFILRRYKVINITDNAKEQAIIPILRLAFRPFFLLGSGYAIVAISIWVWMFNVGQPSITGAGGVVACP